jgi:hypothetical protein
MRLITFLAGCLIAAPLCAVEKDGRLITLTEEENKACEEDGPCLVIPLGVVTKIVADKMVEAYEEGRATCPSRSRI